MNEDDPETVGAKAPTDTNTGVIRPDDLEFEVEIDELDDPSIPFGLPVQAAAGDGDESEPGAAVPTDNVTAGYRPVPPLPDAPADDEPRHPARPAIIAGGALKVHVAEPPAEARRSASAPEPAPRSNPERRDESGSRYALATRGGENTVVAPRRPVVVPGKR